MNKIISTFFYFPALLKAKPMIEEVFKLQMNIFKRFWKSLYAPETIATFRSDKLAKSIIYLILLSFVAFLPTAYYTYSTTKDALHVGEETISQQIPEFQVDAGKLKVTDSKEQKEPISIDQGNLHIYFDATDKITPNYVDARIGSYDSAIAFLTDGIYISAAGNSQKVAYETVGITDKASLIHAYQSVEKLATILVPFILLFVFIIILFSTAMEVLLFAVLGFLLAGAGRNGITFKQTWNIGTYSITLATIFTMVMEIIQVTVPFNMEINLVVSLIFVYLAIRTITVSSEKE